MAQELIVGVIVVVAAAWTVWRMGLRGWVRRRAAAKAASCGDDCGCCDECDASRLVACNHRCG